MSIKSLSISQPPSKSLGFYHGNTYLGNEISIVVLEITRNRLHSQSGCYSNNLQVGSMYGNCLDCKFNFLRKELNACEDSYTLLFALSDNPVELYTLVLKDELVPQVEALDRVLHTIQIKKNRGSKRIISASLKSLTKLDFSVSPIIPSVEFTSELDKRQTAKCETTKGSSNRPITGTSTTLKRIIGKIFRSCSLI